MKIEIEKSLKEKCPQLQLSCIEADVIVSSLNKPLWNEINEKLLEVANQYTTDQISKIPTISASRKAYKACGKDPARYRLSAEALLRRVVSGKGLYQINNVVDQLNLVSVLSGYSIGGYDADQIQGDIQFGIGNNAEPYAGIGRGELNIEFLPVFRDDLGAFGTPTSDSIRTSVSNNTKQFLMIIINFDGNESVNFAIDLAIRLLTEYCDAKNITHTVI